MCGRFYVDEDTAKEIEKVIRKVDENLAGVRRNGDFHPTENAAVIVEKQGNLYLTSKRWGFPGIQNKGVIFNARAESALEKKMFSESVLNRRLIIPVTGFYEWNRQKEKVNFYAKEGCERTLYLAGFYSKFEGEDRFVILTTAANISMQDVHDRMPLILEKEELEEWLTEKSSLEKYLSKVPVELNKRMEYAQQSLVFY